MINKPWPQVAYVVIQRGLRRLVHRAGDLGGRRDTDYNWRLAVAADWQGAPDSINEFEAATWSITRKIEKEIRRRAKSSGS